MSNNCSSSIFTITNAEEAQNVYTSLNRGNIQFCIFNQTSDTSFTLQPPQQKCDDGWDRLLQLLPNDECCYVLYNFDYISESDGVKRSKLIMINWVPSKAKLRSKMLAAVYVKGMKTKFESWGGSIFTCVDAGGIESLDRNDIEKRITSRCTVK